LRASHAGSGFCLFSVSAHKFRREKSSIILQWKPLGNLSRKPNAHSNFSKNLIHHLSFVLRVTSHAGSRGPGGRTLLSRKRSLSPLKITVDYFWRPEREITCRREFRGTCSPFGQMNTSDAAVAAKPSGCFSLGLSYIIHFCSLNEAAAYIRSVSSAAQFWLRLGIRFFASLSCLALICP
jgi:hypothetical protein